MSAVQQVKAAGYTALVALSACATSYGARVVASEHVIIGPKGYTVDWGLPETGDFWVPFETQDNIKLVSDECSAPPSAFVYDHVPRPPWFSHLGLHFGPKTTEAQKACVVSHLKAVPSLTIYRKRK